MRSVVLHFQAFKKCIDIKKKIKRIEFFVCIFYNRRTSWFVKTEVYPSYSPPVIRLLIAKLAKSEIGQTLNL